MPPDSTQTKRRILNAAYAEFAEHGLAGARVDRIADRAEANKRSIYVHFGNKEQLFDLVVRDKMIELSHAVPFTVDDLPGYAGALFDYLLAHPELVRLAGWAGFERTQTADEEAELYRPKVESVEVMAIRIGTQPVEAVDLLSIVLALSGAWFTAPAGLRLLAREPAWSRERLRTFRASMVKAVEALLRG